MLTLHKFIFNQCSRKLKSPNNQFCCSCFFSNSARPIYCIAAINQSMCLFYLYFLLLLCVGVGGARRLLHPALLLLC